MAERDFLPGLAALGVSYEEMEGLRRKKWRIRKVEDRMAEARAWIKEYARDLADLRLALAPDKYRGVMLEAAQWPDREDYRKAAEKKRPLDLRTTLVLYHAEDKTNSLVQIECSGPVPLRGCLKDLKREFELDFTCWSGGRLNAFFGATARENHPAPPWDRLVSRLLEACLTAGRPLAAYTCTFFLPLDLRKDDEIGKAEIPLESHLLQAARQPDKHMPYARPHCILRNEKPEKDTPEAHEAQAWHYFSPEVRAFLFDTGDKARYDLHPIHQWHLEGCENLNLEVSRKDAEPLGARVDEVSLFHYFNGIYCLTLRVTATGLGKWEEGDHWWHPLLYSSTAEFARLQDAQIGHWLRYTQLARILYATNPQQSGEDKIGLVMLRDACGEAVRFDGDLSDLTVKSHLGDKVSSVMLHLAARFFAAAPEKVPDVQLELADRLDTLPEDRAFLTVAYALAGPAPRDAQAWAAHERQFAQALYVDKPDDTFTALDRFAYDPAFLRQQMAEHGYDRWKAMGTRWGFSPYSLAALGYGGFFSDIIASVHLPYLYNRMVLAALFYRASLSHYQRRITLATGKLALDDSVSSAVTDLRRDFILFTNNYWFRQLTPQIQGIEMFGKLTTILRLEEEYRLIKYEMERADEYIQMRQQERFNRISLWFLVVTAVFAVVSLVLGGLGVDEHNLANPGYWFYPLGGAAGLLILYAIGRWMRKQ